MVRIYGLTDPNTGTIRYVGKTSDTIKNRLADHVWYARRGHKGHKNNWIRSLLAQGWRPGVVLLEETENWPEAEKLWIASLRAQGVPLVNATEGGGGVLGATWNLTPEQRAAISERVRLLLQRKKPSPERMRQIALGNKNALGYRHNAEARAKMSAALQQRWAASKAEREDARRRQDEAPKPPRQSGRGHTGHTHSEETKKHWSEIRAGRKPKPEAVAKAAAKNTGQKRTPEQCERIRQAKIEAWRRKKEAEELGQ